MFQVRVIFLVGIICFVSSLPIDDQKVSVNRFKRSSNGVKNEENQWPNGTVPYEIDKTIFCK
jgi:hypothetical protein